MNVLEAAVAEVATELESLSLPHMLVGGLAVSMWGEARATLDSDWTVWVKPEQFEQIVLSLCQRLRALPADPVSFARRTRVLPVRTSQEARADIIFAALPWEREAIRRACAKQVAGKTIPVASVEDLILMKLISERQKDLEDGRRLLRRFGSSLERAYLEPRMTELADALGRPDILQILADELPKQS